jgi:hypothetical protein
LHHSLKKNLNYRKKWSIQLVITQLNFEFEFELEFWCLTFSNISAISWRPVLVVEEAGVPGENHQPWESNW